MKNKYGSSATVVPLESSVGSILTHDITEIRPGISKGAAFRKGHIITQDDLPHLKRIGKENLFVLHLKTGEIHEDDAAVRLAGAVAGHGVVFNPKPTEGKISLHAAHRGLLKVDVERLTDINLVPDISCSSRHNNSFVEKGDIIAALRAIPLIIDENTLNTAVKIGEYAGGIFSVKLLSRPKTALVITGNEVYNGLIEDKFSLQIKKKLQFFDIEVMGVSFAPDDKTMIIQQIRKFRQSGAEMIMVSGGMSVDPDDITRMAIAEAGADDLVYGTPVLPGAMFLYARLGNIPVLGLPACVLFYKATFLDLVLPRILAGETIKRKDLAVMAHGGLCLNCEPCRFPKCPFGK